MNPIDFIQMIDSAAVLKIYLAGGNSFFDFIAISLSYLGTFRVGAILLSLIFLLKKETQPLFFILIVAVLLSTGITGILKEIIARPRPYVELGLTAADMLVPTLPIGSFPSGHTTTAFTVATVAAYHFRKFAIPLFILASIAGLARLYLSVHYPSDIIAGAVVGILSALFVIWFFERQRRISENKEETETSI
ncbi:hypothetical protein MmiHf6_17970 [Methanimicrococcus hongohii]|uniref:Phosphatidic acid phosphatase type 2/haloperoxidase domain-containing protein n=1 Tax=Methanimicrococcus hongohii TaxID=3028295 RepID=A0AA96ZV49_9EURY|nr:phosphatase PAP2 family protein [Methanimicrococcus sp. Hf6]WNY24457.1 hypothetical protein MmiHf6_17970 [Methanimicrococcus sp. Hf6]